ncbi:MAG: response regulator, partial [candidate division WOR-3 bacterium]
SLSPMARILVVDDEPDIRAVLCARLQAAGYAVEVARNGLEALARVRSQRPDLVILDLMLPGADGFSVCAMLKRDQRFADIPVIILSARNKPADQQNAAALGADAYLTKPFRPEELLGYVASLLNRNRADADGAESRPTINGDERIPAPQVAS